MAVRVSQEILETIVLATVDARVSLEIVEAMIPVISWTPTAVTGAGVTKVVAESIVSGAPSAHVSQLIVEVLYVDTTQSGSAPGSGPAVVTSFAFAV